MMRGDLRSALRNLRATPGLTAVAFTLLAAGIGASTARVDPVVPLKTE